MNQIIPSCGDYDQSKDVRISNRQSWKLFFDMIKRGASRHGKICDAQIWDDSTQADALHILELISRVGVEAIEVAIALSRAKSGSHTVAQTNQQDVAGRPLLREGYERNRGASGAVPDWMGKPQVDAPGCHEYQQQSQKHKCPEALCYFSHSIRFMFHMNS